MASGGCSEKTQVQTDVATVDCLIFQGDMMQLSKLGVTVVRNVEVAVNARGLQVKRSRTKTPDKTRSYVEGEETG